MKKQDLVTKLNSLKPSLRISLRVASQITGVPYDTLVSKNRANQLKLIHEVPDNNNQSLYVDLIDLTEFMVHWAPTKYRWARKCVPVPSVVVVKANQTRQHEDVELIDQIADDIRMGAAVSPIWVLEDSSGQLVMVDGFHRLSGHVRAQAKKVWVIVVKLPPQFEPLLTIICNRRHGKNLTPGDLNAYVVNYLNRCPDVIAEIMDGRRVQAELAKELGVSPATMTRAVKGMSSVMEEDPLSSKEAFEKLLPLGEYLHQPGTDHTDLLVMIFHKTLSSVVDGYSAEMKAHLRRQMKLKASPVVRSLDPVLYKLLDRRGGDHRRNKEAHLNGGAAALENEATAPNTLTT